ncbi:hypothetical protein WJU16_00720 [Chitinophaga pollutisoli]|uniref:DUF3127 domain-containing protein n=1 Tax=Chitinophaga pollutisoli TaxID=3133966 RepID=A0ABZ2YP84_9BACT
MINEGNIKSVLVKGVFHFIKNSKYSFIGPFRKGIRPIVWYKKVEGEATSCSLVSDMQIREGDSVEVDLFILNELQLKHPIVKGMVLNVGTIEGSGVNKFADFEVVQHLGDWGKGKLL